jgi:ABC-type Mn2+/Zn2+ transport system permease subunit
LVVGVVLGAALAALGALLLGEYPFTGVMPYVSGVLFALVVAEVIVSVSRRSGRATAVAAAMCTAGGLAWGVWISVGEGKAPIPIGGWVAVVVGFVVALIRGGIRAGARPGASSQPAA